MPRALATIALVTIVVGVGPAPVAGGQDWRGASSFVVGGATDTVVTRGEHPDGSLIDARGRLASGLGDSLATSRMRGRMALPSIAVSLVTTGVPRDGLVAVGAAHAPSPTDTVSPSAPLGAAATATLPWVKRVTLGLGAFHGHADDHPSVERIEIAPLR